MIYIVEIKLTVEFQKNKTMAFKFYRRFSSAEFQRYRDFFPKIESEPSRGGIARTGSMMRSRSDAIVHHSKKADDKARDKITPQKKIWRQRCNWYVTPTPPGSREDDSSSALIPSPASSTVSSTSSTTLSISSSDSTESSRSRRRKASKPRRSPKKYDPKFKGVTFSLETAISPEKQETELTIKSQLSIRRYRRMLAGRSVIRWQRVIHRGLYLHGISQVKHAEGSPQSDSSSTDTDTQLGMMRTHSFKSVSNRMRMFPRLLPRPPSNLLDTSSSTKLGRHSDRLPTHTTPDPLKAHGKTCESCKATRTPLWRDAEDGTPLCNACGIRYKKYRIRCPFCWLIPRKDSKTFPYCGRCGVLLKMTLQRRIHYL